MKSKDVQYYDYYDNGRRSMGMGRALTGLVIGGLIGAAVALLMAPTTGEDLRRTIREELDNAQQRARSMMEDAQERGREVVEGIRGDVESLKENIKDTTNRRRKSVAG